MKIIFVGKNIQVTEALKNYTHERLERIESHCDSMVNARVVMHTSKGLHTIEVAFGFKKVMLRAKESSDDMYSAIDDVASKLEGQLRKYKTKHNKKGNGSIRYESAISECENDVEVIGDIVKRKEVSLKPMSEEEAKLQMNLLNHSFYVYIDLDDVVNVLYKRKDGNYGIIESI